RRHTCFSRDWSSDVCSSDLLLQQSGVGQRMAPGHSLDHRAGEVLFQVGEPGAGNVAFPVAIPAVGGVVQGETAVEDAQIGCRQTDGRRTRLSARYVKSSYAD